MAALPTARLALDAQLATAKKHVSRLAAAGKYVDKCEEFLFGGKGFHGEALATLLPALKEYADQCDYFKLTEVLVELRDTATRHNKINCCEVDIDLVTLVEVSYNLASQLAEQLAPRLVTSKETVFQLAEQLATKKHAVQLEAAEALTAAAEEHAVQLEAAEALAAEEHTVQLEAAEALAAAAEAHAAAAEAHAAAAEARTTAAAEARAAQLEAAEARAAAEAGCIPGRDNW